MSFAILTVDGDGAGSLDVLSLRLTLPLKGAWYGELELDATPSEAPAEGTRAILSFGGRAWSGYVVRSREWNGRTRVFFEAGAAGMRAMVAPLQLESALVRTIAHQIIQSAGERVAGDAANPTDVLNYYNRTRCVAGVALSTALATVGLTWRFTDLGEVWFGVDEWAEVDAGEALEIEPFGEQSTTEVRTDTPTFTPGTTYQGRRVERVVYRLSEEESLNALLTYSRDGGGDLRGAFGRAVRAAVPELPYLQRYPSRVAGQAEDGRVELVPDDATVVAGTPPVPPLYGLPGVRCEVAEGARVGLVHEAGDARRPRAMGWEQSTPVNVTEIDAEQEIKLGAQATMGAVRVGDLADGGAFTPTGTGLQYQGADGGDAFPTMWEIQGTVSGNPVVFTIVPVTGTPGAIVPKAVRGSSLVRIE